MAHQAREVLRAYKEQQGIEQPFAFLQAPLIVHRLFLKKPERIEAVGVGVWRALLLWRLVERALRVQGETTGSTWTGWDKQETQTPTAVMMMIKFAAVTVLKGGDQRQRAPPPGNGPIAIPPGAAGFCPLLHSAPEERTRLGGHE